MGSLREEIFRDGLLGLREEVVRMNSWIWGRRPRPRFLSEGRGDWGSEENEAEE